MVVGRRLRQASSPSSRSSAGHAQNLRERGGGGGSGEGGRPWTTAKASTAMKMEQMGSKRKKKSQELSLCSVTGPTVTSLPHTFCSSPCTEMNGPTGVLPVLKRCQGRWPADGAVAGGAPNAMGCPLSLPIAGHDWIRLLFHPMSGVG